jgi:DNA-directed RNA polymerase specialized sigma24 family protein
MHDDSAELIACIPRLRRYARALLGARSGADDLVQDTMERGWSKLSTWRRGSDMRVVVRHHAQSLCGPAAQADGREIRDMEAALRLLPPEQGWARLSARQSWASSGMNL